MLNYYSDLKLYGGADDIPSTDTAPTANAGADQSVAAGATVTVTGVGTPTTDGATITGHSWTDGNDNILANTATYVFTAPSPNSAQAIVLKYIATDSNGLSSVADTMTVNVAAYVPPVQSVETELTVSLTYADGSPMVGTYITSVMRKDTWEFVPNGATPVNKVWTSGPNTFVLPDVDEGVKCEVVVRHPTSDERAMAEGVTE